MLISLRKSLQLVNTTTRGFFFSTVAVSKEAVKGPASFSKIQPSKAAVLDFFDPPPGLLLFGLKKPNVLQATEFEITNIETNNDKKTKTT